jgi:hypothetical protein
MHAFFVDSTVTQMRSLDLAVFKMVAENHLTLLILEMNRCATLHIPPFEQVRPFRVTSTPAGARTVYPKAFSVLMAPDGDEPEDHDALVAAVRNGDILLFNGWYDNPGVAKIKDLYREAAAQDTPASW